MFARPSSHFLAFGLALLIHSPSQAQEASRPSSPAPTENRSTGTVSQDKPPAPKAAATKPAGDKVAGEKPAAQKTDSSKTGSAKTDSPKPAGSAGAKPASKDGKPASADKSAPKDNKPASTEKAASKDGKPAASGKPQAKEGKAGGTDKTAGKDGKTASTDKPAGKDGKSASTTKPAGKDGKPAGADKTQTKPGTSDKSPAKDSKATLDKDGKPVVAKRAPVGPAVTKKNSLALLPLQSTDWKPGCGCRFFKPTDQKERGPLLLSLDDKKHAAIRAEGNLEQLKLVDERHVQRKPPAIMAHDRMMLKFKGTSTTASFSGSAERNCTKFQDSCKAVTYQGVLSLSQSGKQGSFPVWGVCGCQ